MGDNRKVFVSRAGADAFAAAQIAAIIEKAGYETVLQQWDFANRNFIERMNAALESGARVVSLLSPEYLRSDQCTAEWTNAIADDPLNKAGRLVVLRVADCAPLGLLSAIAYWDLVPILDDPALVRDVVLSALRYDHHNVGEPAGFRRAPGPILDAEAIRESPSFSGRHREFDQIEHAMRAGSRVAVTGLAGVGKSSLARAYAWREQAKYSIVWWLNSETTESLIDGFIRLGSVFVRDLENAKDREQAARRVVAGMLKDLDKPALLIFDNLEDESLLGVWCPRENVRCLITSRNAGWNDDVAAIPLGAWSRADSIDYLKRESGRRDFTDGDAGRLSAELGGLPLALSHAAAYLRRMRTVSIDSYLARLTDHMARAPKGVDYPQAVFGTFRAAVLRAEEESPGAVALLCLAAYFAPDSIPEKLFTVEIDRTMGALRPPLPNTAALEATLGEFGRLDETLGVLDHLSLIEFSGERRRFAMHRLVGAAARALVEADCAAWVDCAAALVRAALLEREDDVPSISADLDNIRSVLRWAIDERKAVPGGADLLNRLSSFWQATGKHAEAHRWYQTVLDLPDAVPADLFTRLLLDAGAIELFRDDFDRAIELLERAIPRLNAPDMRLTRARALSTLATAFYYRVSHDRAEALWQESLEILEAEEHRAGMARVIGNLGLIAWQVREDHDNARAMFGRALALAAEVGIRPLEALYRGNLGEISFATGDVDRAVEFGIQSLEMYRELGNELFVAEQSKLLGKYEIARSHGETARELLREALATFVELGQDIDVAECLTLVAQITQAVGESDIAAKLLAFSLQVFVRGQRWISKQDRARMQALHQDVTRGLGERLASLEEQGRALTQAQAVSLASIVTRQQLE